MGGDKGGSEDIPTSSKALFRPAITPKIQVLDSAASPGTTPAGTAITSISAAHLEGSKAAGGVEGHIKAEQSLESQKDAGNEGLEGAAAIAAEAQPTGTTFETTSVHTPGSFQYYIFASLCGLGILLYAEQNKPVCRV